MTKARAKLQQYWVYILLCENGNYYIGYTNDLARRYAEHAIGSRKCKYTRSFKPICIAQSWCFNERSLAMKIEAALKKMNRLKKEELIRYPKRIKHVV